MFASEITTQYFRYFVYILYCTLSDVATFLYFFSAIAAVREVGQSYNFTCPGDVNKNYTYTFSKNGILIKPDARIKQDGGVLMIGRLTFFDSGQYGCSFYDDNAKKIGGHSFGVFIVTQGIYVLKHIYELL